jgi:N-acyl-L-homoserine lactone synthetase
LTLKAGGGRALRFVKAEYQVIIRLPFRPALTLQGINPASHTAPALDTFLITSSDAATRDIFRLRYRSYHDAGHLPNSEDGSWSDAFDDLASTFHLAVFENGRMLGVMRLCFSEISLPGQTLPCGDIYPEVKTLRRKTLGPIVEVGRMAIDPGIENTSFRATVYGSLVRSAILVCMAANVETLLAGTQAKWQMFYKRILGFSNIAEPRHYPPGNQKIVLVAREMGASSPARFGLNPFFKIENADMSDVRGKLHDLLVWRNPAARPHMHSIEGLGAD